MADRPLAAVDALLSADAAGFSAYCAAQDSADWPDYRLLDAMLIVAARQRWPEPDLDDLVRFARTVPDRLPEFLELPQLFAEALLRTALGEPGLLVGIPASYDFVWQLGLIAALVHEGAQDLTRESIAENADRLLASAAARGSA